MASLLDIVSAGAGIVTGGPAQNKLAAAAVAIRSKANESLQGLGEKLGKNLGPTAFDSLSAGAKKTADQENNKLLSQALNTPQGQKLTFWLSVGGILLAWWLFRKVA